MSEDRIQLLRRIGAGLYGARWQAALANDLEINGRTLRRWVSGDWNIPRDAWPRLAAMLAARAAVVRDLRVELAAINE